MLRPSIDDDAAVLLIVAIKPNQGVPVNMRHLETDEKRITSSLLN